MLLTKIHTAPVLHFYTLDLTTQLALPLASTSIAAGIPPPVEKSCLLLNSFLPFS